MLSLEEYLRTTYEPDCDYVDGKLEERNVGDTRHGILQMWLGFWFISHQDEWNVQVVSELRTRVDETRIRLPDVAVVPLDAALEQSPRTSPLLIAIEILSPDDRLERVMVRLKDFALMGVENVWLIDPVKREVQVYTEAGLELVEMPRIEVAGSPIYLDLAKLFASLGSL